MRNCSLPGDGWANLLSIFEWLDERTTSRPPERWLETRKWLVVNAFKLFVYQIVVGCEIQAVRIINQWKCPFLDMKENYLKWTVQIQISRNCGIFFKFYQIITREVSSLMYKYDYQLGIYCMFIRYLCTHRVPLLLLSLDKLHYYYLVSCFFI